MHEQKGIQKEYNGTERGIRGTLRSPGQNMQHGAPDLVPAAFGKGGGLYAQDLQEGQQMKALIIAGLIIFVCAAVALMYVYLVRE